MDDHTFRDPHPARQPSAPGMFPDCGLLENLLNREGECLFGEVPTRYEPRRPDLVLCEQVEEPDRAHLSSVHSLWQQRQPRYDLKRGQLRYNAIDYVLWICLMGSLRRRMNRAWYMGSETLLVWTREGAHHPATASTSTPKPMRILRGILKTVEMQVRGKNAAIAPRRREDLSYCRRVLEGRRGSDYLRV